MKMMSPLVLIIALCVTGCLAKNSAKSLRIENENIVDFYDLRLQIEAERLIYYLGDQPYTGSATHFYESGEKESEFTFTDGKTDGMSVSWKKNGEKLSESSWADGKLLEARYYQGGELVNVRTY